MKLFLFLLLAPALAHAGPYYEVKNSTDVGVSTMSISGSICVAASTASYSTCTITLDGALGKVVVSTASTSGETMCIAGAHATLPATGYKRGCLLYLTTEPTKLYISTETVVGVQSWLGK